MRRSHGFTKKGVKTPSEFWIWCDIKKRCLNPNSPAYSNYGGRGIKIADEWLDDFVEFYSHVGPRPSPKHTIDRIDNNLGYAPGNVGWATKKEQARNTRRTHMVTLDGITKSVIEWSESTGIPYRRIMGRLARKMPPKEALTLPHQGFESAQRNATWVEFRGEKKTLRNWAKSIGISDISLRNRISKWGLEKAMTTPPDSSRQVNAGIGVSGRKHKLC